ncbi:MAG TPA: hypothetical protein VH088_02025 [Terriglobales bacterium]|nr:hypothetical protein [Terriglobales bacterium]
MAVEILRPATIKEELEIDVGGEPMGKTHKSIRYDYKNVRRRRRATHGVSVFHHQPVILSEASTSEAQ